MISVPGLTDYQQKMLFCIEAYRNVCPSNIAEDMLELFCSHNNLHDFYDLTKDRMKRKAT